MGGQRSQRRKWLKCFEGIQAVWFVAALSSYDTTLLEAPPVVRMKTAASSPQLAANCNLSLLPSAESTAGEFRPFCLHLCQRHLQEDLDGESVPPCGGETGAFG